MDAPYIKRVAFIGKLVAESIAIEPPPPDREPFLDDENPAALAVDEAFDELCGDGGFLRVTVASEYGTKIHTTDRRPLHGLDEYNVPPIVLTGEAELYLFVNTEEFHHINKLLLNGSITPIDILAHARAAKLNDLLQKQ